MKYLEFEWDFDYSTGSFQPQEFGPMTYHAFPGFGTYIVALRVTDDIGQSAVATSTVDINLGNNPPLADAGGPYIGNINSTLELDGSRSVDPDGECGDSIVEYSWDINNDGIYDISGITPTVPWALLSSLPQPGVPNPIQLRISDSLGINDYDQTTITIYDNEPVVCPLNPGKITPLPTIGRSGGATTRPCSKFWDMPALLQRWIRMDGCR